MIKADVDANYVENMATRRSHSGIIIHVIWYSKLENTVEASSFGSEFLALRIAKCMIESLRYKLRCFGIPVEYPAEMFGDKMSVVKNLSITTSALKKRHNGICYHRVKEAQAPGVLRVGWIPEEFNLVDLFTKTTMPGNKKIQFG